MKRFLDTNIFVYAFSSEAKSESARNEIAAGGWVSAQVLSELTNTLRNKLRRPWDEVEQAAHYVSTVTSGVIPVTRELHAVGLVLSRDHSLSIYDGLIVAAALSEQCQELITEDMQHGRRFSDLVIRNPFR